MLVQLDTRQLSAEVAAAQAALAEAQADLHDLRDGAIPEQIAADQAQVAAARGSLQQAVGSVTPADVAAARATLDQARAKLATLQGAPNGDALASAKAALAEAQANLARQRSALSAAKEQANRAVERQRFASGPGHLCPGATRPAARDRRRPRPAHGRAADRLGQGELPECRRYRRARYA